MRLNLLVGHNDMVSLGHYIHASEGPGEIQCWALDFAPFGDASSCSTPYGFKPILDRLSLHGIQARYKPGSFSFNEAQHSAFSDAIGVADKNYRHDPTKFFDMTKVYKQLRFDNGKPQMLLKSGSWYPIWAYILEDNFEACADNHLERILHNESCTCADFCCEICLERE